MSFADLCREAFRSLEANKGRSLLTILGIVIGIAAVIAMTSRVAIARALVNDPAIILADEPTGNLDSVTGRQVMDTFHALKRAGKTIVLITHDASVAAEADRAIQIRDGRVYEGAYVPAAAATGVVRATAADIAATTPSATDGSRSSTTAPGGAL